MTDKQAKEISYAILGGAFIIAVAIRPFQFSMSDLLIGLVIAALFGLVLLLIWLWETNWFLPIAIAAVVAGAMYFVGPWGRERPVALSEASAPTPAQNH